MLKVLFTLGALSLPTATFANSSCKTLFDKAQIEFTKGDYANAFLDLKGFEMSRCDANDPDKNSVENKSFATKVRSLVRLKDFKAVINKKPSTLTVCQLETLKTQKEEFVNQLNDSSNPIYGGYFTPR